MEHQDLSSAKKLYKEGKLQEALSLCTKIISAVPDQADTYLLISDIFIRTGKKADALNALGQFIRLRPANATGYVQMAGLLKDMGERDKALKFQNHAVSLEPGNPDIHYQRALILMALNRENEALDELEGVLRLQPGHAEALIIKGNRALEKSDLSTARTCYETALQNNPAHKDSRINLQLVERFEARQSGTDTTALFLGLPEGKNFGWGICSHYLRKELPRKIPVFDLSYENWGINKNKKLPGPYFFALQDVHLSTPFPARGTENYGYTFFEYELTSEAVENARRYDKVLAGSSWCVDRLEEKGITNTGLLIQGIDPELFYPLTGEKDDERFVLFSGGKFELRKGQDLVLKALQILQRKYPDIHLINIWYNFWPRSMAGMRQSKHIKYEEVAGSWKDKMHHLYAINGLDSNRITTFEVYENSRLRELYGQTDLGIFPNRCEGGTNLVLMEYMACGKPVIATRATGHTDIVNESNALLLQNNDELKLTDPHNTLIARWADPSLDELVSRIEYAYHHREEIRKIGKQAGDDLKRFTWSDSAGQLLKNIGYG
jgi:glycosyltransferase involved in cell wall biosynthesis